MGKKGELLSILTNLTCSVSCKLEAGMHELRFIGTEIFEHMKDRWRLLLTLIRRLCDKTSVQSPTLCPPTAIHEDRRGDVDSKALCLRTVNVIGAVFLPGHKRETLFVWLIQRPSYMSGYEKIVPVSQTRVLISGRISAVEKTVWTKTFVQSDGFSSVCCGVWLSSVLQLILLIHPSGWKYIIFIYCLN